MGLYYVRFFQDEAEVDWHEYDEETLDYFIGSVIDFCCPTHHSAAYFDIQENDGHLFLGYYMKNELVPFQKELLHKTIEFGWGKNRKELRLFGDKIPIDSHIKFQITYY